MHAILSAFVCLCARSLYSYMQTQRQQDDDYDDDRLPISSISVSQCLSLANVHTMHANSQMVEKEKDDECNCSHRFL
jgi:hypothetical protein